MAPFFFVIFIFFLLTAGRPPHAATAKADPPPLPPTPKMWPERFHARLYVNLGATYGDKLQITDLYYDWPAGRNVNLIQKQLGPLIHDVEWNNGTTFYYNYYHNYNNNGSSSAMAAESAEQCRREEFGVGIPRRDFMDGAKYLGTEYTDGFHCRVWNKLDFIWYYEDVDSGRPVRWDFYDGISNHVITFEEGVILNESWWQAPPSCFTNSNRRIERSSEDLKESYYGDIFRQMVLRISTYR